MMTIPRMRRAIVFATDALEPVLELAQLAEAQHFDRVWTTEYVGRDAIARALAIALRTTAIEIGTGVAYAFTRLPLAMAAIASDVQRLSRGRFSLGISPGTRGVRRWFGANFDPPAPMMVNYIAELRRAWDDGAKYDTPPPQIYSAAFNAIMTRHVAGVSDGLLLHPLAAGQTHFRERLLPAVERGAAGSAAMPELVAWRVTSLDPDEEVARNRAKAQLAFYFSTPSYRTVVEGTPWQDVPARIREKFDASPNEPDWHRIGSLLPDDLVDEFALTGTPKSVRERLGKLETDLAHSGITELVFQTVGAGLGEAEVAENCRLIINELGPQIDNQTPKKGLA